MIKINEVLNFLKEKDCFLVLMHASPDGDTIGSATALVSALQKMGKKAKWFCSDGIDPKYKYMTDIVKAQDFKPLHIVSVDVADEKLLGECDYKGKIELSIDHHGSNKNFAEINFVNAKAGANCENIFEIIKGLGVEIDRGIASALYTGISTDTGCFRYSNTTPSTLRISAELLELGADNGEINRIMFETKSRQRLEVEKLALENIEYHCDGKIALVVITEKMQEDISPADLEGITALPRQIEGVKIGVTLKEREKDRFKISVRSFEPYDASSICKNFGGGGHSAAAGCEIEDSVENVKAKMICACKKELEK